MLKFTNPIAENANDPWLIYKDGYYYYCYSGRGGICIERVKNIFEMQEPEESSKVWTPPSGTVYSKELWAPELHYLNGEWYVYVAADDGNNANHRMYVLKGTSQNPLDEFEFAGMITDSTNRWAIDGTVMQYKEEMYFIWSGWEGTENIRQNLYIAKMSDPVTILSQRVMISTPEHDWELNGTPYINEGPVAAEHDGVMHIIYSASGSWSDDYCLGLLTLKKGKDPLKADSWEKSNKPILKKSDKVFGPGHCSVTTSPDGSQTWVIYHANTESGSGWGGRKGWAQQITWDRKNYPVLGEPPAPGEELEIPENTN